MANPTPFPGANLALSYPIYACDFDPQDSKLLVVGGGGGPGRHGVGNKITLIDASKETKLTTHSELDLSGQEDNVTTLAVGPRKDRTTFVYAGVNSSPEDVKKGLNKHFRIFGLSQTKSSGVKIAQLSTDSLFTSEDADTYQRLLRLSQPFEGSPQIGAVATGLSKQPQIGVFDVPSTGGTKCKLRSCFGVQKESMDLDVVQTGPDTYQLAYCDDYDIYTVEITKTAVSEPRCVYSMGSDDGAGRPTLRSLRYLTPGFLVGIANIPGRKGAIIHGYRLPTKKGDGASLSVSARLPKTVNQATGLAVRNLSPASAPGEKIGQAQFVVAVAGGDSSLSLYTLEHSSTASVSLLGDPHPFHTLKSVHGHQITGISLSTFIPPKVGSKAPAQLAIKLASVSVTGSLAVHSIPLKKYVDPSIPVRKGGPPRQARYVVAMKSKTTGPPIVLLFVTALIFVFLAFGAQVFQEARGATEPRLTTYFPASWQLQHRTGPVLGEKTFGDLLADINPMDGQQIVIRHEDTGEVGPDGLPVVQVDVHDEEAHGPAKTWDELESGDKHLWKEKLKEAGHWAEHMGETVFKGILFGELGGAIGHMVN